MNPVKVFIVLVNYNGWENTKECLKSLEKVEYSNFETIVIDNNSDEKIELSEFKVKQIFNDKNLGFAGGCNVGIKEAAKRGASYVLLLNNDTVVDKSFLTELVKTAEANKKIGVLGSVIYEYKSKKIHSAGGKINWLYTKGHHISSISTISTNYVTGACLLIKKEVVEKIGLMNEDYFLYFEDVDWCLKARQAGYKCLVEPKSVIWHKVSSSTVAESFSYIYYHTRNGLLLAKNNAPFLIKYLAYLQSIYIFIKQVIKFILMPKKRKWAKAMMKGIGDFYKGKFGKL